MVDVRLREKKKSRVIDVKFWEVKKICACYGNREASEEYYYDSALVVMKSIYSRISPTFTIMPYCIAAIAQASLQPSIYAILYHHNLHTEDGVANRKLSGLFNCS